MVTGGLAGWAGGKGALAYDSPIINAVGVSLSQLFRAVLIGAAGGEFSNAIIGVLRWV
mgnify:CR=1 FL=1